MKYEVGKIYQDAEGKVLFFLKLTKKTATLLMLFGDNGDTSDYKLEGPAENIQEFLASIGCVEITHITGLTIPSISASTASTKEVQQ